MAQGSAPIDIATPPRFGSASPRNQVSNLTSALQQAGATGPQSTAIDVGWSGNENRLGVSGRHDSISNGGNSYGGTGARPILNQDRRRRESNTGSFANGMSWGRVSVGSWVRDEIMMTGTSPFPQQSPSFHSSSYLPRMEAQFMRDFSCCGITLNSLHELLQHYEEKHTAPENESTQRSTGSGQVGPIPANRPAATPGNAAAVQQHAQQQHVASQQQGSRAQNAQPAGQPFRHQQTGSDGFSRTQLSTVQDVDTFGDMEMDDVDEPPTPQQQHFSSGQSQFGQPGSRVAPLNLNVSGAMQSHQGLRTSTPTTPMASQGAFSFQNNPTVSSVNTPALSTQSMQFAHSQTPESSVPGTPGELEQDYAANYMESLSGNLSIAQNNPGLEWPSLANLTIDQPAKRLNSRYGGMSNQQIQSALPTGQTGNNVDVAKHLLAGGSANAIGYPAEEVKPFKCPVIGCEKAYKNQNGLKYHKSHGHRSQQLKENGDGSYSIVDPETSIPYPGTVGMEKEKPYRCETCGKRYKNLNGLKYHRSHAAACNPDLKLGISGLPTNVSGMNVNVAGAGAGLTGMGGDASMF